MCPYWVLTKASPSKTRVKKERHISVIAMDMFD